MSVCEISDDNERENYSKILMHKSMFINLPLHNQKRELNSLELEEWKTRQLAEREKIRLAESTPEPPERPPKRPDLGLKSSKCILFTTPKPYIPGLSNSAKSFSSGLGKSFGGSPGYPADGTDLLMEPGKPVDGTDHTKQISKKMKPMVPPKPVLTKETKTYLNCRRVSSSSSEASSSVLSSSREVSSSSVSSQGSKSSITSSSSPLTTIRESMSLSESTSNHQISNELSCPELPSKNTFFHHNKSTQQGVSTAYNTLHDNEKRAGSFGRFSTTNDNNLNFGAFSTTNEKNYDKDSGISINNSTADEINQDDNRTSFDDSKTGFVGPQRARLVRVDSQMSDYSVCDINLENAWNLSGFVESSSHHDVNQNIKSSLNLSSNRLSLDKSEIQEKVKLEELQKIKQEKNLLISRIKSKLEIIREERDLVKNEIIENDNTVEEIISKLTSIARIRDIDRIRRHSEEVGSLASLIQCLSYRLEKLENDKRTTNDTAENTTDLKTHFITSNNSRFSPIKRSDQISPILSSYQKEEKLSKLESQLEDAKQLRELSNKRRNNLTQLISELLEEKDGTMFSFCMKEKTRLTLELREFEDKIRSGEEHLNNLMTI